MLQKFASVVLVVFGFLLVGCGGSDSPSGTYILHRDATVDHKLDLIARNINRAGSSDETVGLAFVGSMQAELVKENVRQLRSTLKLKSSGVATLKESHGDTQVLSLVGTWERIEDDDAGWVRIDFDDVRLYAIKEEGVVRVCVDREKPFESTVLMMRKPWVGERKARDFVRWVRDR